MPLCMGIISRAWHQQVEDMTPQKSLQKKDVREENKKAGQRLRRLWFLYLGTLTYVCLVKLTLGQEPSSSIGFGEVQSSLTLQRTYSPGLTSFADKLVMGLLQEGQNQCDNLLNINMTTGREKETTIKIISFFLNKQKPYFKLFFCWNQEHVDKSLFHSFTPNPCTLM